MQYSLFPFLLLAQKVPKAVFRNSETWMHCSGTTDYLLKLVGRKGVLLATAQTVKSHGRLQLPPGNRYSWILFSYSTETVLAATTPRYHKCPQMAVVADRCIFGLLGRPWKLFFFFFHFAQIFPECKLHHGVRFRQGATLDWTLMGLKTAFSGTIGCRQQPCWQRSSSDTRKMFFLTVIFVIFPAV